MIEIAISLAVIGFALLAIIGILPTAMGVQKDNRQETIINQEGRILLNGICNGEQGLDDLTNYVVAITNSMTEYDFIAGGILKSNAHFELGYTFTNSTINPGVPPPSPPGDFALTNGARIIGLLSTPKLVLIPGVGYYSNYVVAVVRSMSGPASEKVPQNNPLVLDLGLGYRMISEVVTYQEFDTNWFSDASAVFDERVAATNLMRISSNLSNNLHNIKLTFRWPVQANGSAGNGRQVLRNMVGGMLVATNEINYPVPAYSTGTPPYDQLYFFNAHSYVVAPTGP
jgi:hypothetical protein